MLVLKPKIKDFDGGNLDRWTRMTKGVSRLRASGESVYVERVFVCGISVKFRACVFGRRSRRCETLAQAQNKAERMAREQMSAIALELGLSLVSKTTQGDARI